MSISELMEIESSTEDTNNVTIVIIENNGNIDGLCNLAYIKTNFP
ncbi:hypothetical protein [Peribacillus simplex]